MKIRVMVVEDEPPIQRSICQKIEETNKNFTVVAAIDNGKDALQYLKEHPVDVMFVDMNLPIVSGKELLDLRNIKYFVSEIYKLYPGNREFFEVEEDIQFILENYYSEKELLKEFNFLLKDIFGIAMYDSGDKKIIALKIKNYLDEMFRTNITNQLLAARFGFVPSYIVSIFKTYYGLTPMDYLVKTRIDESKFLLTNSSLKIKEVANEVGYEDSLYFSKVFKKITGVSPKEYIRSEKINS